MSKLVLILAASSLIIVLCNAECLKVLERKISLNDISKIVKLHNEVRLLISEGKIPNQPRATNLGPLKWDTRLSRKAQQIADTCIYRHVRVADERWWSVGQNLYRLNSTYYNKYLNVSAAVYGWFNEHQKYTFQEKFSKEGIHFTGHYTQLVWAETQFVGCGYVHSEINDGKWKYMKIFVCNYAPGGNILEQEIYKHAS